MVSIPAIRRQEADAAGRDVEPLAGQPVNAAGTTVEIANAMKDLPEPEFPI